MKQVTFITGNQNKADYLARYLDYPVEHVKLDLDEIQSLDLKTIVEHKVRQAYQQLEKPVLVEDVSLEFKALGRLPGPLIKWFEDELTPEVICSILTGKDRSALGRCMFGYFDGERLEVIEGTLPGKVAHKPAGERGFGWDKYFIPDGYGVTRASLGEADYQRVYMRIRPFAELKKFLESLEG